MRVKQYLLPAGATVFFLLSLYMGERISEATFDALRFCGKVIIPQLFVFMCLASVLTECGFFQAVSRVAPKGGMEISAYLIGLLCGFPTGAATTRALYETGVITRKKAEYLLAISNSTGLSFMLGYAASAVGKRGAAAIMLCQMASTLITALALRFTLKDEDNEKSLPPHKENEKLLPYLIVDSVKRSSEGILCVCGFILFFSALSAAFLPSKDLISQIIKGLTEFSTGISGVQTASFPRRLRLSALFIGWSGLCVHFQIAAVSGDVKTGKYLFSKAFSGLFCFVSVVPMYELICRVW